MNSSLGSRHDGGIGQTLLTQYYQLRLLILILLRYQNQPTFQLATEISEAEKFDDAIVRIPGTGTKFLQAKMKCRETVLDFANFFTDKNYDLTKYFDSFLKIKGFFNDVREVIICTNNLLVNNGDKTVELTNGQFSMFLERVYHSDEIFGDSGKRYKFSLVPEERETSKDCLRNNLRIPVIFDQDLEDFMDTFLLVVDFSDSDCNLEISEILKKDFNIVNVEYVKQLFEAKFKDWATDMTNSPVFDVTKLKEFYSYIKSALLVQKFDGMVKSRFSNTKCPCFKPQPTNGPIVQFLGHNFVERILCIQTQPGEVCLSTCELYEYLKHRSLDTFLLVQTSISDNLLTEALNIFESHKNFDLLVFEVDGNKDIITVLEPRITKIVVDNQEKKIIIISEERFFNDRADVRQFGKTLTSLSDLSKHSLKIFLEKPVDFQGKSILYKDLIDENLATKISVVEFNKVTEIGSKLKISPSFDPDYYIERTIAHQVIISSRIVDDIQENPKNDELVFTEMEYEARCQANIHRNVHLLGRDIDQQFYWIKSRGIFSRIANFVKANNGILFLEKSVVDAAKTCRLFVLVDQAGMGKTTFLSKLSLDLKAKYHDDWILNVSLNEYPQYFDTHKLKNERAVIDFLEKAVLNLKTNIEKEIFRDSINNRKNIQIILDGADEVSVNYEENIINLLNILKNLNLRRIFVSTRPEFGKTLEILFQQFRHFLVPFIDEDQKRFLLKYWTKRVKNLDSYQNLAHDASKLVYKVMSEDLRKLIGIPLITRLVADVLADEIGGFNQDSIKKIGEFFSNIFRLYEYFVAQKIRIYLMERAHVDPRVGAAQNYMENYKQYLLKLHQKFSVRIILDQELLRLLNVDTSLSDEELDLLSKCGIANDVDGKPHLLHKTFGEFFIVLFLLAHASDGHIPTLLMEHVLYEDRFKVVRTFLNCCTSKIKVTEILGNTVRQHYWSYRFYENSFTVSIRENHKNILAFLIDTLLAFSGKEESELTQKIFTLKTTPLSDYYQHFVDDSNILDKLEKCFGLEFVKKLLTLKYLTRSSGKMLMKNMLFLSVKLPDNCLRLLKWLECKFSNNFRFLDEFLQSTNDENRNFLFEVIDRLIDNTDTNFFFKVLEEIRNIRNIFLSPIHNQFLEKLFLHHDRNKKTIFHLLAAKMEQSIFTIENFKDFLLWLDANFSRSFSKKVNEILSGIETRAFQTVDLKDIVGFEPETESTLLIPSFSIKFYRAMES